MVGKKLTASEIRKRNELAKKLKKHSEIDEPYALATYMAKKGVKVHRPKKKET